MNQKIQTLWSNLEQNRLNLFHFLEKQDPSVFNRKPAQDKWSVNQNLLHLIEAETVSLQYLKKKLSFGSDLPQAGFKSKVRRFFLWFIFALPSVKFKAPENLAQLPDDLNFDDLKQRWTSLRKEYADFLKNLPDKVLTAEVWRHQLAGKMNIAQMIDFFDDHVNRHRAQIERTLKSV